MEGFDGPEGPLRLLFLRGPQDSAFVYDEIDLPPRPQDINLPPQITSVVPDTFARDSLINRIPNDIIDRVLKENEVFLQVNPRTKRLLLQLQNEMRNADTTKLRPIECFDRKSSEGPPPSHMAQLERWPLHGAPSPSGMERRKASEGCCTRVGGPHGGGGTVSPCGFCRLCEERDVCMWNEVLLKEELKEGRVLSKIPWILAEVYCYR
ncbi:hypothetical protein ACSSS7_005785 [Eimeria intestinalis]